MLPRTLSFVIPEATPSDAEKILAHKELITNESNNGIARGRGENRTLEKEQMFLAEMHSSDNSVVLIAILTTGEIIGIAELHGGKLKAARHVGSIGMHIASEWRNTGVGSALLKSIIEWAKLFDIIKRIELEVMTDNQLALHVYEKFGFKTEGRKLDALYKEGRFIDTYLMALAI